jgi:hypothetical protein
MNKQAMNKESWVDLFYAIGLDDEKMVLWHKKFESLHPEGHQSFLEWLGISDEEIKSIRAAQ